MSIKFIILTVLIASSYVAQAQYDQSLAIDLLAYCAAALCNRTQLAQWTCKPTCVEHPEVSDVNVMYNLSGDASGFLAYNSKYNAIQIVFRATEPQSIANWIDDIDFIMTDYPLCDYKCKVHEGFYHTFLNLQSQLFTFLQAKQQKYPNAQLMITGLSLGGALAHLCAAQLMTMNLQFKFYTFGQPRVGNKDFAEWFNNTYTGEFYRVTHNQDPVPHLPPDYWGFRQDPREIYYNEVNSIYQVCRDVFEDYRCSDGNLINLKLEDHLTYLNATLVKTVKQCESFQVEGEESNPFQL